MTRWFPWGTDITDLQPGDRVWRVGARDQVWTGDAWTLVCDGCDIPMVGRSATGGLACDACGRGFRDVPLREVAP